MLDERNGSPDSASVVASAAPTASVIATAAPSASVIVLRTITVEAEAPGLVGVHECDQFLARWRRCYRDDAVRAAVEPSMQQITSTWKQQASQGPEQRAALVDACRTMIDNFPVQNCETLVR